MAFRIGFCTCLICSSVIYLSYQFHRGPLPNFSWHSVRTPQTLDSMDLTIESFPVFTAQVLGFLVRFRSALENPSKDSTDYVVANQSALHAAKQFSKALRDAYRKAESASVAAKKRSDEIENIYRQARRLVRTKAQACEAQSRYVNFLIAQTMAMGKRGKSAKLDSNREAQSMALVYHPIHAANSLADLRVEWRDAARENEEWMVRDTQAYDEMSKLYHHAVDL